MAAADPREFPPSFITSITSMQSELTSILLQPSWPASSSPSQRARASAVDGLDMNGIPQQLAAKKNPLSSQKNCSGTARAGISTKPRINIKFNKIFFWLYLAMPTDSMLLFPRP
jgi:hypothetical protein